jgi:hypothetical protein
MNRFGVSVCLRIDLNRDVSSPVIPVKFSLDELKMVFCYLSSLIDPFRLSPIQKSVATSVNVNQRAMTLFALYVHVIAWVWIRSIPPGSIKTALRNDHRLPVHPPAHSAPIEAPPYANWTGRTGADQHWHFRTIRHTPDHVNYHLVLLFKAQVGALGS